jgi:hypothetical protein
VQVKDLRVRLRARFRSDENACAEAVAEYADAMREGDTFPPLLVFKVGNRLVVADGWLRKVAAEKAGRDTIEAEVRDGTMHDVFVAAAGANAKHGLPRTQRDKRAAVMALLADAELADKSNRAIARLANVSHPTVATIRREGMVARKSGNQFFTPPALVDFVKIFFGGTIPLDVCSSAEANALIGATRYFTAVEDGRLQPWVDEAGKPVSAAYCNPPYQPEGAYKIDGVAASIIEAFVDKAEAEVAAGNAREVLLLVPVLTARDWFGKLWARWTICFLSERVGFVRPNGASMPINYDHALVYLGPRASAFAAACTQADLGRVLAPVPRVRALPSVKVA